jgi:hypothetical protein
MKNIHVTSNGMTTKLLRFAGIALATFAIALPVVTFAASANIITLGTPSVSGASMTLTGSTESGFASCGSSGGGIHPGGSLCSCCQPGELGNDTIWATCQINSPANYAITNSSGQTVRSGSVALSSSYAPSGCTLQCRSSNDLGNWCKQTAGLSISETGLASGDYTITVTTTDCKGTKTASRNFTIASTPLAGSCFTAQTSYPSGSSVTWNVSPSGGTGTYTYAWTLPDGSNATIQSPARTYTNTTASPITKTANLTVTSGSQTNVSSCSTTIQPAGSGVIDATCSASPSSPVTGQTVTWTAYPTGGSTYTYSWTGSDTFPSGATVNPVSAVYSTTGTKSANVTVTSGGNSAPPASCSVTVVAPPPGNGEVRVHSDRNTTFSLSGPTPQSGSLIASTTQSFQNSGTGGYIITPAAQAGCTVTTSPSSSQTLSSGGVITFNISYTCGPPPTFSCSASSANIAPNQNVTFTAYNGSGAHSWATSGGSPSSGSGTSFTTSYASAGTKTATVTSAAGTAQCSTYVESTAVASVDLDADGYDGPITIASGASALLTWGGQYITGCTASGAWSGAKTPYTYAQMQPYNGESTGPLTSGSYTYTLTCTASGGQPSVSDSVTVNVSPACIGNVNVVSNVATTWSLTGPTPQTQGAPGVTSKSYTGLSGGAYTIAPAALAGYTTPNPVITPAASQTLACGGTLTYTLTYNDTPPATVDIKANNSDAPVAIVKGTQALLSWTSQNIKANSCTASAAPVSLGWSGAKTDNGSQNSAAIGVQTIFTITCRNAADTANVIDSVTVPVRERQCGDGADNDGDGKVDAVDPACTDDDDEGPPNLPECSDTVDNADAEDTLVDDSDPGCITNGTYDPNDNDETNTGIIITACNDGLDNDGDGNVDAADNGCIDPTDPSELAEPDIREI